MDVLLAVVGLSPGVLTETIWALAYQSPPILPERIVVIATRPAREELHRVLFDGGGWNRLTVSLQQSGLAIDDRLLFGPAAEHIRLIPRPDGSGDVDDLTTAGDHAAAADFIMRTLRGFTENPETRVLASIAGGRKTMSALLTSCMILLGRPQDRLYHVLVDPRYESALLEPPFLFPEKNLVHRQSGTERRLRSEDAWIELAEIPFVRVRGWYERAYRKTPPSYMSLVRRVQQLLPEEVICPHLELNFTRGTFSFDGHAVRVSANEFAFLAVLVRYFKKGRSWRNWLEIGEEMARMKKAASSGPGAAPGWLLDFQEGRFDSKEDPRKLASSLRRKLLLRTTQTDWIDLFLPSMRKRPGGLYPAERISIRR